MFDIQVMKNIFNWEGIMVYEEMKEDTYSNNSIKNFIIKLFI